jgi:tyrosinase
MNDQDNIQSFFGVGGIHGLPNVSWDGATGSIPFDPTSGQWGGYCTHGSVLFPTWHRPYVMLYEVCFTSFFFYLSLLLMKKLFY